MRTKQFPATRLRSQIMLWIAIACLVAGVAISPGSAAANDRVDGLLNTGMAQLDAGEYEAALTTFEAAIGIDPMDGRAPYLRGVALNQLGRFTDAANNFAAFVRSGGQHPRLDLDYGTALVHAGQTDTGLTMLKSYAASHPEDPAARLMIGRAHIANEDWRAAVGVLEPLRGDPVFSPAALFHLGLAEAGHGNDEKAEAYGNQLLEQYPDSAEAKALAAYKAEEEKKQ